MYWYDLAWILIHKCEPWRALISLDELNHAVEVKARKHKGSHKELTLITELKGVRGLLNKIGD